MEPVLYKQDFHQLYEEALAAHRDFQLNDPPFVIETIYLKFFADFVDRETSDLPVDIIEHIRGKFKEALDSTAMQVSEMITENAGDGAALQSLIDNRKIIFRRDRTLYNKQFRGTAKKGLTTDPWSDYNHWVIAAALWEGLVRSLDNYYTIAIPHNCEESIVKLMSPDIKPLWGMWQAYNALGRPILSTANDLDGNCIYIREYRSWLMYRKWIANSRNAV
jgi:hypothetical protein